MKRIWFAGLLCVLALVGCTSGAAQPGSVPLTAAPVQSAPPDALQPSFEAGALWEIACAAPALYGISAHDAYYEYALWDQTDAGLLLRTDFASRRQAPLCTLAGCGHRDAGCPAYVSQVYTVELFAINDKLYQASRGGPDTDGARIVQMDPDGANRAVLVEFPAKIAQATPRFTDGRNLYLDPYMQDEQGSFFLLHVDLATGAWNILALDDMQAEGVLGETIVLKRSVAPQTDPIFMRTYESLEAIWQASQVQYIAMHPATGAKKLLYMGDFHHLLSTQLWYGKLYYVVELAPAEQQARPELAVRQIDLSTGRDEMLCERMPTGASCYLFGMGPSSDVSQGAQLWGYYLIDNTVAQYFFIDANTGEIHLTHSVNPASKGVPWGCPLAVYDGQYLVYAGVLDVPDVAPYTYALIDQDDFWAGKSDCRLIEPYAMK